ncbi:MAG TPA: DNA-binding transcriptional regulator Fis [Gammaproteobacteria bacterium]|nr:DNA-binding transcriptional regulator Fis [Gammaproteobacteria bacterium]
MIGSGDHKAQDHRLRDCVARAVERYFENLDGAEARDLYQLVLTEMEKPLLERVLENASGNQCLAARMLGINRNTLRTKLQRHGILFSKDQYNQTEKDE